MHRHHRITEVPDGLTEDMFDRLQYPQDPGHQNTQTSLDAAKAIKPAKKILQDKVMAALEEHGPMTSFEIADKIGCKYSAIQPRTTELKIAGKIEETGDGRRYKDSKVKSAVWRIK